MLGFCGFVQVCTMAKSATSAASLGLLICHSCGQLSKVAPGVHEAACARCGSHLHARKPDSIARTWAFLIAAIICYIPANVLPVMETGSLFGSQSDTIMSGVIYLWTSGSWPLALLIFFASITVPALKIVALIFLSLSVQFRSRWRPRDRARLYRLVEFVGRWSMLDIFVIAILVALVQFSALATIRPAPGVLAFGAVVVLTMFAAQAFEPRLIWDNLDKQHG